MERLKIIGFVAVIFLFPSCVFAEYSLERYYPLGTQDNWVYSVSVKTTFESGEQKEDLPSQEVTVMGPETIDNRDAIKLFIKNGENEQNEVYLIKDSEGIKKYLNRQESKNYEVFDPPYLVLPLKAEINVPVGNYSKDKDLDPDGKPRGELSYKRTITLLGLEDITVEAGTFKGCLKFSIEETEEKKIEGMGVTHETVNSFVWVAPGVGRVKEIKVSLGDSEEGNAGYKETEETQLKKAFVAGKSFGN